MSLFSDAEAVETMQLEKALGLTTMSNATFCTLPTGQLVYAAGCVAVLFDPELNVQKGLFKIDHAISALCVSSDGRYLAIGSRGGDAHVYVYDIVNGDELAELKGHKYGVGCMSFSHDSKLLVTCGFKLDKQMLCWNWRVATNIYNKIGNRVHSALFNSHGNYFVTCGDRHLKWWYFSKSDGGEVHDVRGFPASIMEAQRYANFTDCSFGLGSDRHLLYCSTAGGGICIFQENRIMDKYVPLNCASANCLFLSAGFLYAGCADGQCNVYSAADMKYVGALPKPEPLYKSARLALAVDKRHYYPACYAIRMVPNSRNIAMVYADRSMVIWDASDIKRVSVFRLLLNHRACIWDIQFLVDRASDPASDLSSSPYPPNTFVTCSADASVRIWNIDPKMNIYSKTKIPYCKDVFKVIETSLGAGEAIPAGVTADLRAFDICTDIPDTEQPYRIQVADSPRCMAMNPNGREFACGDRTGKIKIFDVSNLDRMAATVQAHDSEVLSLSYSPILAPLGLLSPKSRLPPSVLLASGGRDSLVHVFDVNVEGPILSPLLISTLSLHDSAVSIVKFTPDGQKLVTCGSSDERMVFSRVFTEGDEKSVVKLKSISTPNGAANGLTFDATNKYAITSGQNKRLNIWNLKTGRQARSYFLEAAEGELYRSDMDPSGMYIATCSLDRKIRIFDFFSGDVIAEVYGHSDAITGVKFSPDGRYILSIGGDGCILVWKVPPTLVGAMQDRLLELYSTAQERVKTAEEAAKIITRAPRQAVPEDRAAAIPPEPPSNSRSTTAAVQPDFMPPLAPPISSKGPSRWMSRVKAEESGGYELFGQKIAIPNGDEKAARVRNKFTLEVSRIDVELDGEPIPASPGSSIANQYEDQDNVNVDETPALYGIQDGQNDAIGFHGAIKTQSPAKKENVRTEIARDAEDLQLSTASLNADSLHRSAIELEGWLEQQLSEEASKSIRHNALSSSMSAAYYAKLKSGDVVTTEVAVIDSEDGFDAADVFGDLAGNLSPAKGTGTGSSTRSSRSAHPDLEVRSQKTAAAVDQMRDRLLAMGILYGDSSSIGEEAVKTILDKADKIASPVRNMNARSLKLAASNIRTNHSRGDIPDENSITMPPPPSLVEENRRKTAVAVDVMRENLRDMGFLNTRCSDDGNETESTASGEEPEELDVDLQEALEHKTKEASNLLRELERVSREAAQAVSDLQLLRRSVSRNSISVSKTVAKSPPRNAIKLRASPILIPSASPSKASSGFSGSNVTGLDGKSGSGELGILRDADEIIASFRQCCSSLAASVSVASLEPDENFRVQHIAIKRG